MMAVTMDTATAQQLPLWTEGSVDANWRLRRSRRARRLSVRVFGDGAVEIVVPERLAQRHVASFLARHRDWIERHRRRVAPTDLALPPARIELRALGETWDCHPLPPQRPGLAGRSAPIVTVRANGAAGGRLELRDAAGEPALRSALLDWLTGRADAALKPRLHELADELAVRYRRVQIRHQRTRWGSCSARGTISLNCCLLFHRPAVVRYLLVHELAHLTHMNHSPRFWELVARHEPQWRALDRKLLRGWAQVPAWLLAALRAPASRPAPAASAAGSVP